MEGFQHITYLKFGLGRKSHHREVKQLILTFVQNINSLRAYTKDKISLGFTIFHFMTT
jgi:hypothetical protein